jgi:hypothetical protein
MIKKLLASIVKSNRVLYRVYLWLSFDRKHDKKISFIYNPLDLNTEYYDRIKNIDDSELEHQIGRLTNFKNIIKKCQNLEGDFIEFGVWQGFSTFWIAYFLERNAIFTKKIVGLDSFSGLPYADGIFDKFAFSNTSLKLCKKNLLDSKLLYPLIKKNILIGKFLYSQKKSIISFFKKNKISKFCFIHIDCDVSESVKEIFEILSSGNLIADECYILFDDYGCETKLKITTDDIFEKMKSEWDISVDSSTKLTKNFLLKRNMQKNS